jgi:hypothetical protein
MKHRAALATSLVMVLSGLVAAQPQEFSRVVRNGEEATLSVFGARPVDLAAKKLVDEFSVAINVEDPVYWYRDDVQDLTSPRAASFGRRLLIPKAALLEVRFNLTSRWFPSGHSTGVGGFGGDRERAVALCISHRPRWRHLYAHPNTNTR